MIDCSISGNSTILAVSSYDYIIRLYNLNHMTDILKIETNSCDTWKVMVNYNGSNVYTGAHEGEVHCFDAETGINTKNLKTKLDTFITSFASNMKGD